MRRKNPRQEFVTPEQAERIKRCYTALYNSNRSCLLLLKMMRNFPEDPEIAERVVGEASRMNSTLRILRCIRDAAKDEQPATIQIIFATYKEDDIDSSELSNM